MNTDNREDIYRAKLNLETSQIAWKELQRHFASGVVRVVTDDLDLVEVAYQISENNVAQVSRWLETQQLAVVSDDQARTWWENDAALWAVVISPWVLVQQRTVH